jgi:hypothetical protein
MKCAARRPFAEAPLWLSPGRGRTATGGALLARFHPRVFASCSSRWVRPQRDRTVPGAQQALFNRIAGAVIIIFGLHTMGVLRIEWLYQEKRVHTSQKPPDSRCGLVGVAFAFGWTPCIGPILAGILALAGSQETVSQGVRLLASTRSASACRFWQLR